jgi:hypothetical protein
MYKTMKVNNLIVIIVKKFLGLKKYFNVKYITYFENNYNDLLVKLNYESDQNW